MPVGVKRLLEGLGRRMPYPHDLPEDLEHRECAFSASGRRKKQFESGIPLSPGACKLAIPSWSRRESVPMYGNFVFDDVQPSP